MEMCIFLTKTHNQQQTAGQRLAEDLRDQRVRMGGGYADLDLHDKSTNHEWRKGATVWSSGEVNFLISSKPHNGFG